MPFAPEISPCYNPKIMVLFSEMFVSELINDPVVDVLQESVGKVKDILITLGETFPKVSGLLVEFSGGQKKVLLIGEIELVGKQFIATRVTSDRIAWANLREGDLLLMRDVVDQQVVDLDGARVIRVNDLKLAKVGQDIRLIAADVGLAGMVRRLGLEKFLGAIFGIFGKKIPEQLIGWDHVQSLSGGKVLIPGQAIAELHPSDVAEIISQLKTEDKTAVFSALSENTAAEAMHELEPFIGAMLIAAIDTKKAVAILEKMPVDEAADIIGDLPPEKSEELLRLIKVRKANEIKKLIKHKDESAGGLMTTEYIALPQNLTVNETIERLRKSAPDAETIYYVYVLDEEEHLVGILSLRSLIVSSPDRLISEIMIKHFISATPEMNQREVAQIISKYNLLALPVLDPDRKILGIITVDDVIDFILPPISRRKKPTLG
ncbi:hypothetical protein A2276_03805 [candidate division WOR-1 bacterium RIFOXYA12_FULL_43_27]|nr:MAG: hypothetical protein A2276_03805 [candidate division WOR-1 bacterium RIFOXYA12_FULL_43_27]OGC19181.1 MAG: hypothetical protein A2292_00530 [candidate division WOR-1 bacterium RIFOXYB2_FULL_46_45]OGC30170.1 MAG: hypothetical protein A2232_00530 [candidate division WOR-1 bacterium RIFOXYA2_FULL_46_56]